MEKIWAVLVEECEELGGVGWEWQSADAAMGKARFGGDKVGPNPTDRGKKGTKRSIIVEQDGGPLGAVIAGANVHDTKLLAADHRVDRCGTSRANGAEPSESLPRQGLRQSDRPRRLTVIHLTSAGSVKRRR